MKKSVLLLLAVSFCTPVFPSNLVYTPVNPVFGGSPLNGSVLMNVAQAQNTYKDPKRARKKTAAQKFSETLQRSILNRIAFATSSTLIDANGNLIPTATPLQTNDFTISISDIGGGNVGVTVVDKITGQTTEFSVCQGVSTNQVCP